MAPLLHRAAITKQELSSCWGRRPFGHNRQTIQTNRTDRQRSDSI